MIPTKVHNMVSSRGNKIPNQFLITTDEAFYFQSYETIIAKRTKDGKIFLDVNRWDYSPTTGKYRNQFLNENINETRKKIDKGIYILKDLNKWKIYFKVV